MTRNRKPKKFYMCFVELLGSFSAGVCWCGFLSTRTSGFFIDLRLELGDCDAKDVFLTLIGFDVEILME